MSDRYLLLVSGDQAREISVEGIFPVERRAVDAALPHPHAGGGGVLRYIWWKSRPATAVDLALALPLPPIDFPPLRPDAEEIYSFVVHEMFHLIQFSEQRWTSPPGIHRAQDYPVPVNRSLYRTHVYHALQSAVKYPGQRNRYLAEGAYWNGAYINQFPEYATSRRFPDAIEGAARFFDVQMLAAALINEPADDQARRLKAAELSYPVSPGLQRWFLSGATESYLIGEVAGAALDIVGNSAWRSEVAAGRIPTESLLESIDPPDTQPEPDAAITQENAALVTEHNRILGIQLEPAIQGYLDPGHVLLLLPPWWEMEADLSKEEEIAEARKQTVQATAGSFASPRIPYQLWGSWVGAYLLREGNFVIKNVSALTGDILGSERMIVPLDPALPGFQLSDGHLTLHTDAMYGTLQVEELTDGNGRTLLKAIAND